MKYISNKLYNKVAIIIALICIISSLLYPANNISAYSGGLMEGKVVNKGADHLSTSSTTSVLTDNSQSTATTLVKYGGGDDTIFYDFPIPVTITDYQLYANSTMNIYFYDSNNIEVGSVINAARNGVKTSISPINNVAKVAVLNVASVGMTIYEFDTFGDIIIDTTTDTNIELLSGSYELTTPNNVDFGTISLSGTSQNITKPLGIIEVSDLTYTGQGWRLQAQASSLSNGTNTLPLSSLQLKAPLSISTLDGTTTDLPTVQNGNPWLLDAGSDITILSAALNQGMGSYSVDFTNLDALTLNIPSNAKVGTYNATITWKIVVGP